MADTSKTQQPPPKLSRWINSTTDKKKMCILILGVNYAFKYKLFFPKSTNYMNDFLTVDVSCSIIH